jgi:hypothetical protein
MKKTIIYKESTILLAVTLNSGTKTVTGSDGNQTEVLTHSLATSIDAVALAESAGLSDDELLAKITSDATLAEQRIDIKNTPQDSPVVNELITEGFVFD